MRSEDTPIPTPITSTEGTSRGGARLSARLGTRVSARRTGFLAVGAAGALLLALTPVQASAAPSASSAPSAPAELEALASAQGTSDDTMDAVVEVNEVSRDASGQYATVVYTIEYDGSDDLYLGNVLTPGDYGMFDLAGVSLVDAGNMKYRPLTDADDRCLCSERLGSSVTDRLESGESVSYWAMYPLEEGVESVDVDVPEFGEITDVPVS
ncbi:hypothetical protein IDM40_18730 [Nocardiopsis sp. HNM0947]|uniref:DUF5067 domain-containing protein n=1 Tax=Nocardiopsis coralli TaxID=2772213 RepID=A0ABR9PA43_9ACTN|nr:hypothetical protein [Nocardiopsis coralli]MBE3000716.1 hypothetical protein [Nocardiopsis coralli]